MSRYIAQLITVKCSKKKSVFRCFNRLRSLSPQFGATTEKVLGFVWVWDLGWTTRHWLTRSPIPHAGLLQEETSNRKVSCGGSGI